MRSFESVFRLSSPRVVEMENVMTEARSPVARAEQTVTQIINPYELEMAYRSEPVVFNAINVLTNLIVRAGYSLQGQNVPVFYKFLDGIGTRGGSIHLQNVIDRIYKYQLIYGNCYVELLFGSNGDVADMDVIDPKTMDFARDQMNRVIIDKYNKPMGFVQSLPNSYIGFKQVDKVPKGVVLLGNQIFLSPNRVVHFKKDVVGNGFYGVGIINPVYNSIKDKQNLQHELTEASLRRGAGIVATKVGDLNHEPTKNLMDQVKNKVGEADYKTGLNLPYYVEVSHLETRYADQFTNYLEYYKREILAGLGVPEAFATGTSQGTSQTTLKRQEYILKITLNSFISSTVEVIETQIFRRIAKENNLAAYPKIKWGNLAIEELDSKARRLSMYAKQGLIDPTNPTIQKYIQSTEGLNGK